MVSQQKLDANRANAQKSTGPRTPEGKSASSQNPSSHGAFCRHLVLPGEDEHRFLVLRRSMLASLNPQTTAELFLADRVCSLMWRLDRLQSVEAGLYLNRCSAIEERAEHYKATHDTSNLDPDLLACLDPDTLPEGFILARVYDELPDRDNPFERVAKAEQRLNGMLNTSFRRLRELQADRRKYQSDQAAADHPEPDCPFLGPDLEDDEDDHDDHPAQNAKLQNKPNRPPSLSVSSVSSVANPPAAPRANTPTLQNKPKPKTTQALYQAATRAAGDLLPPLRHAPHQT